MPTRRGTTITAKAAPTRAREPESEEDPPQDPREETEEEETESEDGSEEQEVKFALTPGLATDGILDFTKKTDRSHFGYATKALDEEHYNCTPDEFYQFIQSLKDRANEYGWDTETGLLAIPMNSSDPNSPRRNLLGKYGTIDLARVQEYAKTFIGKRLRKAQDDRMLFHCLMNTLSKDGKRKITIWRNEYVINGGYSGICLLKVIIREGHLDTNATTSMIRTKLSNLDTYIHTVGNDITKFNGYVRMLQDTLRARGETTSDLLTNLFKGYAACSDKNFVDYIRRKQERYDEGDELTATMLMNLADTKFKQLKDKEIWEAPSPEEEKLIALEAKVQALKQKFAGKRRQSGNDESPSPAKKQKKGDGKQDDSSGNSKGGRSNKKEKPKWMFERPADDKLREPREWNGKKWYWCSPETGGKCTGQYRIHKPSKCEGKAFKHDPRKKGKHVVIQEALNTVVEPDNGYESPP